MPESLKLHIARRTSITNAPHALGLVEGREGTLTPIIIGRDSPFADKSIEVAGESPRGLLPQKELERIETGSLKRRKRRFDSIPVVGKMESATRLVGRGLGAIAAGERETTALVQEHAIGLYNSGRIRTLKELRDYTTQAQDSPTRLLALDVIAPSGQFLATRTLDAIALTLLPLLMEDKVLAAKLGAAGVGFVNGFFVKTSYLLGRISFGEIPFIVQQLREKKMSKKRALGALATYGMVAIGNLGHLVSYPMQPLIGVARDQSLAYNTAKVQLRRPRRENNGNYYADDEMSLSLDAQDKAKMLADTSKIPILTASEVGNSRYDTRTSPLSRAHATIAQSVAQVLNGATDVYVDVLQYVNNRDFLKFEKLARRAKRVASSPRLHDVYNRYSPLIRRIVNPDKKVQPVVDYFAKSIASRGDNTPVITTHYSVGNALLESLKARGDGRSVVHYVTDPSHIHTQYLKHKDDPRTHYFVFDKATASALEDAGVDADKISVTGFSTHPDLSPAEARSVADRKLRVGIFTGGVGTNRAEIETIVQNFNPENQQLVVYCGTHTDIMESSLGLVSRNLRTKIVPAQNFQESDIGDEHIVFVVGTSLEGAVPASYKVLNWSDVVATKPSGDIAIEAVLSGHPVIPLSHWGVQEDVIDDMLHAYGATIDIPDLKNIGAILSTLQTSGLMQDQIDQLREELLTRPLFESGQAWRQNIQQALDRIMNPHQ